MKDNIKRFLNNGGRERIAYWGLLFTLVIYIVRALIGSGEYKNKVDTNARDIRTLKERLTIIDEIRQDIAELKANQQRILEILQGKYKR